MIIEKSLINIQYTIHATKNDSIRVLSVQKTAVPIGLKFLALSKRPGISGQSTKFVLTKGHLGSFSVTPSW